MWVLLNPILGVGYRRNVKRRHKAVLSIAVLFFTLNLFLLRYVVLQRTYEKHAGKRSSETELARTAIQNCLLNADSHAKRAIDRVKTVPCRAEIKRIACQMQQFNFYPPFVHTSCPLNEPLDLGKFAGCYFHSKVKAALASSRFQLNNKDSALDCVYKCIRVGAQLAGVTNGRLCFCGDVRRFERRKGAKLNSSDCDSCAGDETPRCDGPNTIAVFKTGIGAKNELRVRYPESGEIPKNEAERSRLPRIAFLLQLNGRDVRQVKRLFKLIYHPRHLYYIHVDSRQEFMYREMLKLEALLSKQHNFLVKRDRLSALWGGSSILDVIIRGVTDLAVGKLYGSWDFVLNLSESDLPVMPLTHLEAILNKYRGKNFLATHSGDTKKFVENEGLMSLFYECEHRMWHLGPRPEWPKGIRISGGSDWIILSREFSNYIAKADDEVFTVLRRIYRHTIISVESFFHTLALNTRFCGTLVNGNLKHINWKREIARDHCLKTDIVDWCIWSPHVIKAADIAQVSVEQNKRNGHIFTRKFEALIDQTVIRLVEAQVKGTTANLSTVRPVWLNEYHFEDREADLSPTKKAVYRSLIRRFLRDRQTNLDCIETCEVGDVKEVNALKVNNSTSLNLLLKFQLVCKEPSQKELELRIKVSREANISETQPKVGKGQLEFNLTSLEVGTKFDIKENVFRNYDGIIGRESRPVVRLTYSFKQEDVDFVRATTNSTHVTVGSVTVHWYDPNSKLRLAKVEQLTDPQISPIFHSTMELSDMEKLDAGLWTVKLMSHSMNGNRSVEVGRANFPVFSADDFELADRLIDRFYTVVDACLSTTSRVCLSSELAKCQLTEWSSLSSDTETDILTGWSDQADSLI